MWTVGTWHVLCHIPRNHSKKEHACHLAVGTLCTGRGLAHSGRKFRISPSFLDYTIAWWPLGPCISEEALGLCTSQVSTGL